MKSQYILPHYPPSFPSKDGRKGTCGMHTLKAVIEWHDPTIDREYSFYVSGYYSRLTWYMLPSWLLRVLKQHGLLAKRIHCRWASKQKKLETLKSLLHQGPVILLISHAYSSTRNFSFRRAFTLQHYISLRWYDDHKRVFYIYDSNTHKPDTLWWEIPIGNMTLSYDTLLRCRRLGWRWLYRDFGIAVAYII